MKIHDETKILLVVKNEKFAILVGNHEIAIIKTKTEAETLEIISDMDDANFDLSENYGGNRKWLM